MRLSFSLFAMDFALTNGDRLAPRPAPCCSAFGSRDAVLASISSCSSDETLYLRVPPNFSLLPGRNKVGDGSTQ